MKPWQTKTTQKDPVEAAPAGPLATQQRVQAINALMAASTDFWRGIGKKQRQTCQFRVADADEESWFVVVDAEGGRATAGVHPSPVVWSSDREALDAAFTGRLLEGRVRIEGDYELLRSLFKAIAQTSVR